jgi:hypothetical protein
MGGCRPPRSRLCASTAKNGCGSGPICACGDSCEPGKSPGAESSVGKVHQGELNQRIQLAATDVLGMGATAWTGAEAAYEGSLCPMRFEGCSAAGPTPSKVGPPK